MNLFIESIEGGTYLAGIGNESAERMLRDSYRNNNCFQSLTDLKSHVAGQKFDKIWLKQNTPYDEMCGAHEDSQKLMIELLDWQ